MQLKILALENAGLGYDVTFDGQIVIEQSPLGITVDNVDIGMGLQADGRRGFQVRLGHEHPVSYPFELRYKETIDLYQACLKEAAEYRLVLDFHGANKPAGESRTWPNELTREGIRGYEFRGPWAAHNATLPFTRILAGHADYTPMHFGDRRCETSEAHQIASAIIFTSPLLIFADHPREILEHEAVELIKRIPC